MRGDAACLHSATRRRLRYAPLCFIAPAVSGTSFLNYFPSQNFTSGKVVKPLIISPHEAEAKGEESVRRCRPEADR